VDNYKSLINLTFRPREQNLLIGVNNSGKTNLCQAMVFLAATSQLPLDKCAEIIAGGKVGLTNLYLAKRTIDFHLKAMVPFESTHLCFQYDLRIGIQSSQSAGPQLEVEDEALRVTGDGFDDVVLVKNSRDGVRLLHELAYLQGDEHFACTSAPRDTTMLHRLYDLKTNPRANCFKMYLSSWQYYALSPEALRGFQHRPNQVWLNADGGNLASVVYHLKTMDERHYRRVLGCLQQIDPRIDVINFSVPSEEMVFMYFEDAKGNPLLAANASSGTLRFLGLLYLLLVQPRLSQNPLVIIEEPENGVYVGFLKEVLELVEETQNRPQLIFTSHSPYFIDLFDNRLDSIFVMKSSQQHSSITQPDEAQVKKRLEKYPLGEQHFREMLG
jgi:predicted ATPase